MPRFLCEVPAHRGAQRLPQDLLAKLPHKIDIGAIFSAAPRDHKKYKVFEPLQREFIIDSTWALSGGSLRSRRALLADACGADGPVAPLPRADFGAMRRACTQSISPTTTSSTLTSSGSSHATGAHHSQTSLHF